MRVGQHLINKHNASLCEGLLALWAARARICTRVCACTGRRPRGRVHWWPWGQNLVTFQTENVSWGVFLYRSSSCRHPNLVLLLPLAMPLLICVLNPLIINVLSLLLIPLLPSSLPPLYFFFAAWNASCKQYIGLGFLLSLSLCFFHLVCFLPKKGPAPCCLCLKPA